MNSPIQTKDPIPSYPFNYRGVVEDDQDPLNAGRVRVRVYPMFTSLPVATLPWAVPAPRITSGAGNGYGEYATPEVGSWVYVFFEAGDIQQPVYFASAPSATQGLPTIKGKGIKTIQTKGGITITLNDLTQEIKIAQAGLGAVVDIATDGSVSITRAGQLAFGVVTGECICPFTGVPHADVSLSVKAGKL